jgi:hypothetical protein
MKILTIFLKIVIGKSDLKLPLIIVRSLLSETILTIKAH